MDIIDSYKKSDGSYLGALSLANLPFVPKRIFYVSSGGNSHCTRGNHAHHQCRQLLICISGIVRIKYENQSGPGVKILTTNGTWLHENLEWAHLEFLEKNSALLSLCSEEHRDEDYIRNYDDFLAILNKEAKSD